MAVFIELGENSISPFIMTELQEFWVQFMESQMVSIKSERILTKKEVANLDSKIELVRNMSEEEFEAFRTRTNELHRELGIVNVVDL